VKNTKLIKLLQTFQAAEIKKFRDFVNSPYFNKNKNIIKLNNELEKYYPEFDPEKVNEELIYKKVFGTGDFDYFKIKNIISDLYNLGLEFLKQQSNIVTSFSPEYNMLTQLRIRKLTTLHKNFVAQFEKKLSQVKIKDGFHLHNEYLLVTERHLSNLLEKPSSIEMIQDEFNSFHDYTLINMLKFYALMLHISKENNTSAELKMFDEVFSYIENSYTGTNPIINIYKYIILLTVKRNTEYYYILKEQFIKNSDQLTSEEAYYTLMYIFGYCMDQFNINSDRKFIKECYDLFNHSYRNNMVFLGELLYPDFINYVKVYMRFGDKALSGKFIDDYSGLLPADQLDNCINFSNAFVYHCTGELKEALALISKVSFPLQIMKVQVKIMQIQLNYQLGYYEETREQAEYFRKSLVKEEQISHDYKQSILGFLKLTVSLINIKLSTDESIRDFEAKKFTDDMDLNQKNHFGIKFWLEDRFAEIGLK
jgi:hypothetical protein